MLLMDKTASWQRIHQEIEKELESGQLPREQLEWTLARIQAVKKRLARPNVRLSNREWDRLARRFQDFTYRCEEPQDA
jgi:hypothetical protein